MHENIGTEGEERLCGQPTDSAQSCVITNQSEGFGCECVEGRRGVQSGHHLGALTPRQRRIHLQFWHINCEVF